MRTGLTWLGVCLVVVMCGAPLFVSLGQGDLANDEAIYSFAVDRILETGDWLVPKSSPTEDGAFLEKPPLKMWMVAAPIRMGLLPHNEFGLRFWDAAMGVAVFVYVFLLGARVSNTAGGVFAALILFVQAPLLFTHGLRSNNMEAAQVLCYAGGMYHFVRWAGDDAFAGRRRHAIVVGLYFVLGFMTKFVAALFLPVVMGVSILLSREGRRALGLGWRDWTASAIVAAAVILPWFIYATLRFGEFFWHIILGVHVYERFTAYLDPAHVQPWWFYFGEIWRWLVQTRTVVPVVAGIILLAYRAVANRRFEAMVVVLWLIVPLAAISVGTSKLYHYAYPFLPPIAIAGGAFLAAAATVATRWFHKALDLGRDHALRNRPLRTFCAAIAIVACLVAIATAVAGPIDLQSSGRTLLKNGGIVRPVLIMLLFGLLGGSFGLLRRATVPVVLLAVLPLAAYRDVLSSLTHAPHPLRSASRCVNDLERTKGEAPPGLYVDVTDEDLGHPVYYYFRRIRPWERAPTRGSDAVAQVLYRPGSERPALMSSHPYSDLVHRGVIAANPVIAGIPIGPMVLLLPGPYAACADTAAGTYGS